MKLSLTITFSILLFSYTVFSQNGYLFKYNFNPNKTYTQTIDQKENSEITYMGDSTFNAKLKQNKLKSYESSENIQHIEAFINTDSLLNDSIFKIIIQFTKTLNNNSSIISNGTKIFAHCNINKFFPIIDSFSLLSKTKDNDQTLLEIAKSAIINIDFPKKSLNIGEFFLRTYPIPVSWNNNEQVIISVGTGYKLLSVDKGIATFEIKQIYKINLGKSKIPATITGEGKGILLFDIQENFYTKYELNTKLIYKVKKDNYTVQTSTTNNLTHQVSISKK